MRRCNDIITYPNLFISLGCDSISGMVSHCSWAAFLRNSTSILQGSKFPTSHVAARSSRFPLCCSSRCRGSWISPGWPTLNWAAGFCTLLRWTGLYVFFLPTSLNASRLSFAIMWRQAQAQTCSKVSQHEELFISNSTLWILITSVFRKRYRIFAIIDTLNHNFAFFIKFLEGNAFPMCQLLQQATINQGLGACCIGLCTNCNKG